MYFLWDRRKPRKPLPRWLLANSPVFKQTLKAVLKHADRLLKPSLRVIHHRSFTRCDTWKAESWSQKRQPLLVYCSIKTRPQQRIHKQQWKNSWKWWFLWGQCRVYRARTIEKISQSWLGVEAVKTCEMVVSQQLHKHKSRRIWIVGNRWLTTTGEDIEDFILAPWVTYRMCLLAKLF
jgi:hypothetical protein